MPPFFSIIIPVYNVAPYLRECLDSVLAQTFTDWEAICVDDGSTDGSGAILDEYAAKDKRFNVIHQTNAGVGAARNAALDAAQGEYVWFVDGDDAAHPGALAFLKAQFDRFEDADVLFYRGSVRSPAAPAVWPSLDECKMQFVRGINSVSYDYAHTGIGWTAFRKSVIGALRFEPLSMSEDTLFIEIALWKIGSAICGKAPLFWYRSRQDSATGSVSLKKTKEWLQVEHRMADHLDDNVDRWRIDDMQEFFAKRRNEIWFTYTNMMFRLPLLEMRQCINLWVTLQQRRQKLYRETFYRRIVVATIQLIPSAFLLKLLVWDLMLVRCKASSIVHKIYR